MLDKFLPYWMSRGMLKAAAVMAGILFVISYAVDLAMAGFDVSPASTVFNDALIALIATGVMLFYLFSTRTEQIFLRAKERMNLTAELNHHLRHALTDMRNAAELPDRGERLHALDRAMEEVDHLLIELVPTVSADRSPRYSSIDCPEKTRRGARA